MHADDVAEAYRLAATDERARGAYNVAADPVLDAAALGRALGARPVRVPVRAVRAAAGLTWRARLQPTPPGWLDMGMAVPLMSTRRIREELGWAPRHRRRRGAARAARRACGRAPACRRRRSTRGPAVRCACASC